MKSTDNRLRQMDLTEDRRWRGSSSSRKTTDQERPTPLVTPAQPVVPLHFPTFPGPSNVFPGRWSETPGLFLSLSGVRPSFTTSHPGPGTETPGRTGTETSRDAPTTTTTLHRGLESQFLRLRERTQKGHEDIPTGTRSDRAPTRRLTGSSCSALSLAGGTVWATRMYPTPHLSVRYPTRGPTLLLLFPDGPILPPTLLSDTHRVFPVLGPSSHLESKGPDTPTPFHPTPSTVPRSFLRNLSQVFANR